MHGKLLVVSFAVSAMLSGCNTDRNIVGSYIGGDENAKMMLRIAEIRHHKISGEFTVVTVSDTGKLQAATRPLSGTVDSGHLNLNVEGDGNTSLINGVASDGALELTFFTHGDSFKLKFDRRDPKEFEEAIDDARQRAAVVIQNAEAEIVRQAGLKRLAADQDQINSLSSELTTKAANVAESIGRIESIAASHAETPMNDASDQHAWTAGALQALNEAEKVHEGKASVALSLCRSDARLDCAGIKSALGLYRLKAEAMRAAINREQFAYENRRRGKRS